MPLQEEYIELSRWLQHSKEPARASAIVHLLSRLEREYPKSFEAVAQHVGPHQRWSDALYDTEVPNPAYLTMMVATQRCPLHEPVPRHLDQHLPQRGELASTLSVEFQPHVIGEVGWMYDEVNQAPYLAEVFDTPLPEGRLPHVRVDRAWPDGGLSLIHI